MRKDLTQFSTFQVFLNYPFDEAFAPLANAMQFAVVAAGLLPVCARDLSTPDRPRLDLLVEAIKNCRYSAHDFSRFTGEGEHNFARFNMPIEMGMALFHALDSQRKLHRCAFFVSTPHDYRVFASDLAGLDPVVHDGDELKLLTGMYEWLANVVPRSIFTDLASIEVSQHYKEFKKKLSRLQGSGANEGPSHAETREVMYKHCTDSGLWDFRANKAGREELRETRLIWKTEV